MTDIKEKINKLEASLIALNAPVIKHFNPGLPKEHILEVFSANNINPDPTLIALYEWHNGTPLEEPGVRQAFIEVLPTGMFYTLKDMIRLKKEFLGWEYLSEDLGDMNEYWPVFGSREDDMYLLKNTTGEVYYISPHVNIYGNLEFKSIDALVDCVNECYQEKIFVIDPRNGVDADFDKYEKMRLKYNS